MTTLASIGEHEAIRRLTGLLASHPDLRIGAGDDCAVARLPGTDIDQVFTTDPVVENVHFESSENPERIGRKAVGRVLSDIAAMGAVPQWLLVDLVAPPSLEFHVLERIYEGMLTLGRRFGATLIGGDVTEGPCLELHVFGTGLLPAGSALLRSGARQSDLIFVTGPLGCSGLGKHLDFIPRVEEGVFLRETGMVTAMMDISDGLATDLRHILDQNGVGGVLEANAIPLSGTLDAALYEGEDFELLFTIPADREDALCLAWSERFDAPVERIGCIDDATGLLRLILPDGTVHTLKNKAFEHFSR